MQAIVFAYLSLGNFLSNFALALRWLTYLESHALHARNRVIDRCNSKIIIAHTSAGVLSISGTLIYERTVAQFISSTICLRHHPSAKVQAASRLSSTILGLSISLEGANSITRQGCHTFATPS